MKTRVMFLRTFVLVSLLSLITGLFAASAAALTTDAPVVSSPIAAGATSVSGTSTEADGTTIQVYVNGSASGSTTTVTSGAWTKTGLAALIAGDLVKAKATANLELESLFSNEVAVQAAALADFLVEAVAGVPITRERPGVAFNIKITARDGLGNTFTSFSGSVNITSTGTLSSGSGATLSFTNGVLASHSVTYSNTGAFTITATDPITTKSGTSNSFTVSRIFYVSDVGGNDGTGDGTITLPFKTIAKGINTAIAADTVLALAGTYVEAVNVTKSLVLMGSGAGTTKIEAPLDFATNSAYNYGLTNFNTERTIVHIGAGSPITVTLRDLTIDGKGRGPDITLQHVAYSAILAEECNVTIAGNSVKNMLPISGPILDEDGLGRNGRGIYVRGNGAVALVDSNVVQEINRFYVLISATEDPFDVSKRPVVFPQAVVSRNTITGKGTYGGGQKGIWFNTGAWGTISGNTLTNFDYTEPAIEPERSSAIVVRYGYIDPTHRRIIKNNTISASTFLNNKGIYAQGIGDSIVDNIITGVRWAIEVHDGNFVSVLRNTITGGRIGVHVTTEHSAGTPDSVLIGGSAANRNTITGQDVASGGFAIALSFRDPLDNVTFKSSIPVNARYNDFGVYTEAEVKARIWDRADTTMTGVDTVLYYPFFGILIADVKAYLQGPFSAGSMMTALNDGGFVPKSQPYSAAPWGYSGLESVSSIPAGVVDWVMVELRNSATPTVVVARRAAFIKSNGAVVDLDGTSAVMFGSVVAGNYYIVLGHRNHLEVMSATVRALSGTSALYDFTTGPGKYHLGEAASLPGGTYGLFAGDANGNGQVQNDDMNDYLRPAIGQSGYKTTDINLNGQVQNDDMNDLLRLNIGKGTQVP